MEKVVLVKSLYRNTSEYLSKEVAISGWIRTLRASNAFGFIEVNDGSFFKNIQVVFDNKLENFKYISKKLSLKECLILIIHYKRKDILLNT